MPHLFLGLGLMLFGVAAGALKSGPSEYVRGIEKWRAQEEADLKRDESWLTLAGLYWLKEGDNSVGTAEDSAIVLPEGSGPKQVGTLTLTDGKVTLRLLDGVSATIKGNPISVQTLKSDADGSPDRVSLGRLTFVVIHRGHRIGIRMWDHESRNRAEFTGMKWFPVEEKYRIVAKYVPYTPPKPVTIMNVLGDAESDTCDGYVTFSVDGHECRLDALKSGGGLFFNFRDASSGRSTYPAGRFLYTPKPENGSVTLDFNQAENPPCAFTQFATCPLPTKDNILSVAILAGEKTHHPTEH